MKRQSGILMPIFSLPTKYGIGSFGSESYKFVDFLASAKQKVWQILPLVQTGYGNSPYSSVCSTSFNPYFISVETLKSQGLITKEDLKFSEAYEEVIDYGKLYGVRYPILRAAFNKFDKEDKEFKKFVKSGEYRDYALFMAIKRATNYAHFYDWEDGLKYRNPQAIDKFYREHKNEITFWEFTQFIAKNQWLALKKYANDNGVKILGDMPLYVALDSVDVWVNPKLFKLNDNFIPKKVAGVPPDYFCREGQLWGNPVYDYESHKADNFSWWTKRLKKALKIYDYVRIDHFRGLDRYYEIENGAPNAINGEWVKVPSKELFDNVHKVIGKDRIIAEDLGIIDDGVRELLSYTGYPGMKILSFAFDGCGDNLYLPQNITENSVCYTGTHDNDTLQGLIDKASEWDYNNLVNGVANSLKLFKLKMPLETHDDLRKAIIKLGFNSRANLFIMPIQDLVGSGTDKRINEPGTVKDQNWAVRISAKDLSKANALKLYNLTKSSKR